MDHLKAHGIAVGLFALSFVNALVTLLLRARMTPSVYRVFDVSWWITIVAGLGFFIYARFYAK